MWSCSFGTIGSFQHCSHFVYHLYNMVCCVSKVTRDVLLQEGGVTLLRFSPAESALAVCSGGGHVSLWELNLADQGMAKVGPHVS